MPHRTLLRARGRGAAARQALAAAGVLPALLAGGCAIVDQEQRRWIFQPTTQSWAPGLAAAVGMDDVWIAYTSSHAESSGQQVRLHGLWLPQATDPAAPVLLYLHGARWDVRASAPRMRDVHALGFAVLGIDYRGFGRSSGALPSETLALEDAHAAWRWLAAQHPGARRFVFGHSLGASIAVQLVHAVDDESGLIVEGAFPSLADVFASLRFWGALPLGPLITQRFDAGATIDRTGSPVLVVHGSEDGMVPPRLGRALYDRAGGRKRFVLVEGGLHEDTTHVGRAVLRTAVAELFGIAAPGPRPAADNAAAQQ